MKRKRKDLAVSLFPFLSILACVIGSITLMIASAVLSQIDPHAVAEAEGRVAEEVALRREFKELKQKLADAEAVLSELQKLDTSLAENQAALDKKEAEYAVLQEKLGALIGNHPARAKLLAQTTVFEQRINELQPVLKEKLEKIASLQQLMKERKDAPPREGKVIVRPTGSGQQGKIKPLFVDCRDTGLVVHDGGLDPWAVKRSEIANDSKWISLLKSLAAGNRRTVVFLVRANGIPVFGAAEAVCLKHEVRSGHIPVQGLGELDLSYFK